MRKSDSLTQHVDWWLFGIVMLMLIMGIANVYSAAYDPDFPNLFDFSQKYGKQIMWVGISLFLGFVVFLIDSDIYRKFAIPIYLFLWVTWIGCSHNVRKRTHLNFNELRTRMSYGAQFACMCLDAVLWIVFGAVVLYFTIEQTLLKEMNFAIVQGTDNVMQWWFYLATPLAWMLLIFRVLQNLRDDIGRFRRKAPFIVDIQAIGKD